MQKSAVLECLTSEQDARGIEHEEKHAESSGGLKSYGIGLTRLRKYAKGLGRDAKLAKQLWKTKFYDATLAKTPFAVELMEQWVVSTDPMRKRCGHGLLYEISKWKKKSAPFTEAPPGSSCAQGRGMEPPRPFQPRPYEDHSRPLSSRDPGTSRN